MDDWEVITDTQEHDNIQKNTKSNDAYNEGTNEDSIKEPYEDSIKEPYEDSIKEPHEDSIKEPHEDSIKEPYEDSIKEPHDVYNKNKITDELLNNTSNTSEMWSSSSDEESNYQEHHTNLEYRSLINGNNKNYKTFENKDKYNKTDDTMIYIGLGITIIVIIGVYNLVKF